MELIVPKKKDKAIDFSDYRYPSRCDENGIYGTGEAVDNVFRLNLKIKEMIDSVNVDMKKVGYARAISDSLLKSIRMSLEISDESDSLANSGDVEAVFAIWKKEYIYIIKKINRLDDRTAVVNLVNEICIILQEEYELISKERILGCPEEYASLGDNALLVDGDLELAYLWYSLSAFDWYGMRTCEEMEIAWDNKHVYTELLKWRRMMDDFRVVRSLSHDDMYNQSLHGEFFNCASKTLQEAFKCFRKSWESYRGLEKTNELEAIVNSANECIAEYNKMSIINSDVWSLRSDAVIAWSVFDLSKLFFLYSVCENAIEGSYDSALLHCVESIMNEGGTLVLDKMRLISLYYRKNKENDDKLALVSSILCLSKTMKICDRIRMVLRVHPDSTQIAYYTSLHTLERMLPSTTDKQENIGRFALMHAAYMNDPNEGVVLKKYLLHEKREKKGTRKNAEYPYVFLKCFTTRVDDLSMWEMYGDHAGGCCVVVSIDKLMSLNKTDISFYNVCYIEEEDVDNETLKMDNPNLSDEGCNILRNAIIDLRDICDQTDDEILLDALLTIVNGIDYLFKNAAYMHEQEKRLIFTCNSGLDEEIRLTELDIDNGPQLLYYLSDIFLCIEEIVLGPKIIGANHVIPYLQRELEKMNGIIGSDNYTKITFSSIEYR